MSKVITHSKVASIEVEPIIPIGHCFPKLLRNFLVSLAVDVPAIWPRRRLYNIPALPTAVLTAFDATLSLSPPLAINCLLSAVVRIRAKIG